MARFRTRPVEVDAVQWTGSNYVELQEFAQNSVTVQPDGAAMYWSRFGSVWVPPRAWVLRDDDTGPVVIPDSDFTAKYEPVEDGG